jgi:hypothetical protein
VISKFIYGRFKIAHTFSFGIMGALLGYFIIMDVPERKFMIFSLIFFLVGMLILGISALMDWKFLLNFANEDVPIWVQIFNLGGQVGLFSVFMKYLEFAHNRRRHEKAVKLTIWLRRFGVVSLTIYTLGKFLGDGVFWLFEGIMGPAVDLSGINPILAWNMGEIYLVMATLIGIWFLVLRIWEKIEFIPSMEWILGLIAWILRMKKSPSLHVDKRLYIKNQIMSQPQEISK